MDGNNRNPRSREPRSSEGQAHGAEDSASVISIAQLRHLVRLLDRSDVSEIELRRVEEGTRLLLRKVKVPEHSDPQNGAPLSAPVSVNVNTAQPSEAESRHPVTAPLVGIFHTSTKLKGKPLVAVGERVKAGQHVAAIESLNVINEVEAPVAGQVVEVLVQEGQPVEYGQSLMIIESAAGSEGA